MWNIPLFNNIIYFMDETMKYHNVKGLSPIVGIMLLVTISTILSVSIYIMLVPSINNMMNSEYTNQTFEKIKIDSVKLNVDSSFIIVVRNIGDVKASIDTIYLIDPTTNSLVAYSDTFFVNNEKYDIYFLESLSVIEITGSFGISLTQNKSYEIKVVTKRGNEGTFRVVATG